MLRGTETAATVGAKARRIARARRGRCAARIPVTPLHPPGEGL